MTHQAAQESSRDMGATCSAQGEHSSSRVCVQSGRMNRLGVRSHSAHENLPRHQLRTHLHRAWAVRVSLGCSPTRRHGPPAEPHLPKPALAKFLLGCVRGRAPHLDLRAHAYVV
eukprot:1155981-Pelagomonas_calceolata.AAC.1